MADFAIGDTVVITAWGYGVTLDMVGLIATVVGFGRTRVKVAFTGVDARNAVWPEFVDVVRNIPPDQLKGI